MVQWIKDMAIGKEIVRIGNMEEKKYLIENAELIKEWDWENNNKLGLNPYQLTCGSGKQAWWRCIKNHKWKATINHRNHGHGCPYCAGQKVLAGYNDLQTTNPILASEWNYEKNTDLTPEKVTENSSKKVWWKCKKGHEWEAQIYNRNNGRGCPYCAGRKK